MTALSAGAVIAERYRLETWLGRGGMGLVWSATNLATRRKVALKFMIARGADEAETSRMRRRFMREARTAAAVRHPNVIDVMDVLTLEDGAPVMVMELLTGESLSNHLVSEPKLPLERACSWLMQVSAAVGAAHGLGIVHRDLKPDNVFLVAGSAPGTEVRVLDFGIARAFAVESSLATGAITGTGAVLGTPRYMSPEQLYGEKDLDHRSDLWSIGVMLYECLAGDRPFVGDGFGPLLKAITKGGFVPLYRVAPEVPADVSELVDRLLATEREARPSSVHELIEVLARHTSVRVGAVPAVLASARADISGQMHAVTGAASLPPISGDDAFAATAQADISNAPTEAAISAPAAASATADGVSTHARSTVQTRARSRKTWAAVALGVLAVGGVSFALMKSKSPSDATTGSSANASRVEASAASASTLAVAPTAYVSAAATTSATSPQVSATAPSASQAATAAASSSAVPPVIADNTHKTPRGAPSTKTTAVAAPSSPPPEPTHAAPASSPSRQVVVEKPPF